MVSEPATTPPHADERRAWRIAAEVTDPELPMLTLADLGILRDVHLTKDGTAVVTITPTYSGCPALAEIRANLHRDLRAAGYPRVETRTALSPPWSSDWITTEGRRKLAEHGISPPGPPARPDGAPTGHAAHSVPLVLLPTRRAPRCPLCGSPDTEELSRFGATACRALLRCRSCREPFEHLKEV